MWNPGLSSSSYIFSHILQSQEPHLLQKLTYFHLYVGDVVETTRSGENILVGKKDQRVKLGLLIQCRRQSGQAGFDPETIMISFA